MKQVSLFGTTLTLVASFGVIARTTHAAVGPGNPDTSRTNTSVSVTNQYVVSKSGNGQTWESVKASTNAGGIVTYRTNYTVELGTGMHYLDSTSGEWKPSDP